MYLGPIHALLGSSGQGHDPVKQLKLSMTSDKQIVLFDKAVPYSLQSDVMQGAVPSVVMEASQTAALVRIHQIEELCQNAEWHRCGIYIQWREDGTLDGEDGWYNLKDYAAGEDTIFSGYAEGTLTVELRDRRNLDAGVYVDSKTVPNDANLSGVACAAYPQGFSSVTYPAATYSLAAADGSTIHLVENAPSTMRGPLPTPLSTMSLGRCSLLDGATEVFYNDHRFLGTTAVIGNQLVRYTVNLSAAGSPLIEVWNQAGAAWATVGNYQTQCYDGFAYTTLPVQGFQPLIVSPEEIVWEERRYDSTGYALTRVINRIRRGSLIVESQVVAASGLPLTGLHSIALVNIGALTVQATSTDGTASVAAANAVIPGFLYLSKPPVAASVVGTSYYSGLSIASGTVGRFGILCGIEDTSMWATFAGATNAIKDLAYATKWASYNRMRIRQRLMP